MFQVRSANCAAADLSTGCSLGFGTVYMSWLSPCEQITSNLKPKEIISSHKPSRRKQQQKEPHDYVCGILQAYSVTKIAEGRNLAVLLHSA